MRIGWASPGRPDVIPSISQSRIGPTLVASLSKMMRSLASQYGAGSSSTSRYASFIAIAGTGKIRRRSSQTYLRDNCRLGHPAVPICNSAPDLALHRCRLCARRGPIMLATILRRYTLAIIDKRPLLPVGRLTVLPYSLGFG